MLLQRITHSCANSLQKQYRHGSRLGTTCVLVVFCGQVGVCLWIPRKQGKPCSNCSLQIEKYMIFCRDSININAICAIGFSGAHLTYNLLVTSHAYHLCPGNVLWQSLSICESQVFLWVRHSNSRSASRLGSSPAAAAAAAGSAVPAAAAAACCESAEIAVCVMLLLLLLARSEERDTIDNKVSSAFKVCYIQRTKCHSCYHHEYVI